MKQFQITSRPRHLRYVYFINDTMPYQELFDLICSNLNIWGGRYNPIIPVNQNTILDKYSDLLKNYDPDFVFYTKGVDPEIIKRLQIFNPVGYFDLYEQPRTENIDGVNNLYLLSQLDPKTKVLLTEELWKTKSILLDYFKLNFGLDPASSLSDFQITKGFTQLIVDASNFNSLNEIIYKERPINQSLLSARNINTKLLRTRTLANFDDFEIIIAKDKSSITDLIYYWNRFLYECFYLIYFTVDELDQLKDDKYFGGILNDLSINNKINVSSFSLTQNEINELINVKLKPLVLHREFKYKNVTEFPFKILDASGIYEREYGESSVTQTLISDKGLFQLPQLSFTEKVGYYPQRWAIDISFKKAGENYKSEIKFPLTTNTNYIIRGVKGRINRLRNLSIIIHNQANTSDYLDIEIPDFKLLLNQLVCKPVIHGETQKTRFNEIGPNDASNKLLAFLKSFNYDFLAISDFFGDIFWVSLFEHLITNEKSAGDSILFSEMKKKVIETLNSAGIILGLKDQTFKNEENLERSLKRTLEELCSYRVFFKGFKLKCPKCSSEFWYHINETKDIINCKGCLEDFNLPIEPDFAYKLNDLIKNNIFQTKKNRDGNLTVIRTLSFLENSSKKSFEFSPQINIYDDPHSNKPCAEIDIICLSDGELIIGESKHNSQYFTADKNRSLKSLVEIAKTIHPDKIVLSSYEDQNEKLEKAKNGLVYLFNKWDYQPKIELILLSKPDEFQLGGFRYFYY